MSERNYETPENDYSYFPIEDFKVGDTIYDKRTGNRVEGEIEAIWKDLRSRKIFLNVRWENKDAEVVLSDWIQKEPLIDYFDSRFIDEKEKVRLWNEDSPFYTDREAKDLDGLALKVPDERDLTTFVYSISEKTASLEEEAEDFILNSNLRYDKENDICYFLKGNRKIVSSYKTPEEMDFYIDGNKIEAKNFFDKEYDDIIVVGMDENGYYIDWGGKYVIDSEKEIMEFVASLGFEEEEVIKIVNEDGEVELRV